MESRVDNALREPVFLVGAPRSGTTWLQRVLLDHPLICGGQESHFFRVFRSLLDECYADRSATRNIGLNWYWQQPELLSRVERFWVETFGQIIERKAGAEVLLEKTPDHALDVTVIHKMLPGTRFIHMIRDSRAVSASLIAASREDWGKGWAPSTAKGASLRWYRYVSEARRMREIAPVSYHELHYEDMLDSPVEHVTRVLSFLDVKSESSLIERMVQKNTIENQKRSSSPFDTPRGGQSGKYREPKGFFRTGRPDKWKSELSLAQKLTIWRYTRRLMGDCGYGWSGRLR